MAWKGGWKDVPGVSNWKPVCDTEHMIWPAIKLYQRDLTDILHWLQRMIVIKPSKRMMVRWNVSFFILGWDLKGEEGLIRAQRGLGSSSQRPRIPYIVYKEKKDDAMAMIMMMNQILWILQDMTNKRRYLCVQRWGAQDTSTLQRQCVKIAKI